MYKNIFELFAYRYFIHWANSVEIKYSLPLYHENGLAVFDNSDHQHSGLFLLFAVSRRPQKLQVIGFNRATFAIRNPSITGFRYIQGIFLFLSSIFNVEYEIRGLGNYIDSPSVIVCNHQSSVDLIGIFIYANLCFSVIKLKLYCRNDESLAKSMCGFDEKFTHVCRDSWSLREIGWICSNRSLQQGNGD